VSLHGRLEDTGRLAEADHLRGALVAAAVLVVNNAYGTRPRHTRVRAFLGDDGLLCRDDCVPCGIDRLRQALVDLGAEGVLR
jgi:hypothetical protein